MKLTFLGTGSGMPTKERNVASAAVRISEGTEWLLFDCGEGTQHQVLRSSVVRLSRISKIFITHLHADHVLGLSGLLASRGLQDLKEPVTIFGPEGTSEFVTGVLGMTDTTIPFPLYFKVVSPGIVYQDSSYTVSCAVLDHGRSAFGYRIQESDRPGKFNAPGAIALGVPVGPLFGRLKNGESVNLPDGTVVNGRELCGPPIRGKSLVFCSDTAPCYTAVELARNADLLVHEATFSSEEIELARKYSHSTAAQAAGIAMEADVGRLILTHFSARYGAPGSHEIESLLSEAREVFPLTDAAEDFMIVSVGR